MSPPFGSGRAYDYLDQYGTVEVTLCDFLGFVLVAGTLILGTLSHHVGI